MKILGILILAVSLVSATSCAGQGPPTDQEIKKVFERNRTCLTRITGYLASRDNPVGISLEGNRILVDPPTFVVDEEVLWVACMQSSGVKLIESVNDSVLELNAEGDNGTFRKGTQYGPLVSFLTYRLPSLATGPTEHKGIAYVEDESKLTSVSNTDDFNWRNKKKALPKYLTIYAKIESHWYVFYEASR